MAFVMIATGATSRSRVRTLQVRPLVALAGLAALALLGSGGAVGYWVAEFARWGRLPRRSPLPSLSRLRSRSRSSRSVPSRRALFRLESEAAQLSRRIGALATEARAQPRARRVPKEPGAESSHPLRAAARSCRPRAARPTSARSTWSSAASSCRSPSVASVAAEQSVALMRLPTRLPIADAELTSPLRHPHRSVRAHARLPRRPRLRGARRHADRLGRRRRRRLRRLQARLRLGGRDRPRQRPDDALRARFRAPGATGRSGRSRRSHRRSSARPDDRPGRTCTSRC